MMLAFLNQCMYDEIAIAKEVKTMAQDTKKIRLILRNSVVELEGTPEELSVMIENYKLLDTVFSEASDDSVPGDYGKVIELDNTNTGNVIHFPARGVYAHPSNPDWGKNSD